jgi:2-polyprenyl-3-methyl-5-hydroxy-6-metoxy-1,4-benzoquinol methylase
MVTEGQHRHEHGGATADLFTQETWDARYAESERIWSGRPNRRLVDQLTGVDPGDALDVGAGEGADAVWLARRGWRVTALDVSEVALRRVAEHAAEAGVAERVSTLHHDLMTGAALPGAFDLVSAQYLHPPVDRFTEMMRLLGAVVRPRGRLLVVGHHPDDLATGLRSGHGHPELLFTPEKVVDALPEQEWDVQSAGAPTREADGPDGPVTVTDTVVLALRR